MKRQLIRLASTPVPQWVGRMLAGRFVPIFMLHRYVNEQGEPDTKRLQVLRQQLQYVQERDYRPLRLFDLLQQMERGEPLSKHSVIFTVDDGFFDQAEILGPLFAEFDIPFTCFVISDFLDGRLWPWDDQLTYVLGHGDKTTIELSLPDNSPFVLDASDTKALTHRLRQTLKSIDQTHLYDWLDQLYQAIGIEQTTKIPPAYRPMTWKQAEELIRQGHDIAPHTRSHRILSRLNDQDAECEILESWEILQQRLTGSVPVFAYPTGRTQDFSRREHETLAKSALIGAVTTDPAAVTPGYDRYTLPRYGMPHDMTDFIQYLDWIEVVKNRFRRH